MTDDEPPDSATIHQLHPKNPFASSGLYTPEDYPERKLAETWKTGFFDWSGKIALAPGTLSVVTGLPGSGKTHLMAQIWHHVVGKYNLIALVASFECAPKPHYHRYLREFHNRKREAEMGELELARADRFISEHYRYLGHPQETPTLEWFLQGAELAVAKWSVKIVQLDPWNRLESQRGPKETEPEYVARCLRTLTVFAKDTGCHVQIVAHPAKRDGRRREMPPDLEDISGAMHWWNMVDQGFVVHREKLWDKAGGRNFDATFTHAKARFEELGHPCRLAVRFNPQSRVFEAVVGEGSQ